MNTYKHYPTLTLLYQGIILLSVMLLSRLAPATIVSINQVLETPFTAWESWLLIALNASILFASYHWGLKDQPLGRFPLGKRDLKAMAWGFATIFLIGYIGSNLMLLTNSVYHTSLQRTLLTIPILPQAFTMLTTSVLAELFFRRWLFSWFSPDSPYVVLLSTSLFCLYQLPTNIGHFFLYLGKGLALSRLYQKTQNIYAAICLHILWNAYTLIATIMIMV